MQYELPTAYGSPRRAPVGAVDHDLDHDYAFDDEGSVRAVHRDDDAAAADPEPAPAPRTRQEYVEQQAGESNGRRTRTPASPRRRWIRRGVAIAVVVVLIPVFFSYVSFLRKPGTDTIAVRSVEWLRDHGGNGVVNTVERWWYTNNPPPTGGRPDRIQVQGTAGSIDNKTGTGKAPTVTTAPVKYEHLPPPTNRVPTPAPVVEPNEGVWQPVGRQVAGMPAEYITFVRPDAAHTAYYTAFMWLDTKLLKATYVPGLQEPGGNGPNPWGSMIPPEARGTLIAAFNSGFKMDQARGGVYYGGTEIRPLVPGAASIVVFKDGTASVGMWGRDFNMSPDIESVRQNLELLVDNGGSAVGVAPDGVTGTAAAGQLNPALREDDTTVFGATLGNNVYVWRSGVGVTATGALVYAGGPAMSVLSLSRALQNAGAVRAMELDINTDWVSAYTYRNENPADPNSAVTADKLGGDMSRPVDRYLTPGERDFFAFFANPKVEVPAAATTAPSTSTTKPTTTTTKPKT